MRLEEVSALNTLSNITELDEFFRFGVSFERNFRGLFIPIKPSYDDIYRSINLMFDDFHAREQAPLLRKTLLDESLPLKKDLIKTRYGGFCPGGRIYDAMLLGMINYSPSIPELLEVATHDVNTEMRSQAVDSLGDMGKEAEFVSGRLLERLFDEKDMWIRARIADSLSRIGGRGIGFRLRDACENLVSELEAYEAIGYFGCGDKKKEDLLGWGYVCLDYALQALFKSDKTQGREMIARLLNSPSTHVYMGAKRAFFFSGMSSENKLLYAPEDLQKGMKKAKSIRLPGKVFR